MAMDKIREYYRKQKEQEKEDETIPSLVPQRKERFYGVGNPHEHRYKEKVETILTEVEFEQFLENAKELEQKREEIKNNPKFPFDSKTQIFSISGLLAMLYYTGLRITEIVGDKPHKYKVFKRDEEGNIIKNKQGNRIKIDKWTKELHGIRKMDLSIVGENLRVDVKEVRKHGKREQPVWIPLSKSGINSIVEAWGSAEKPKDRVFPITKWLAWRLISEVTEGRLYPHYFRLNRATKFATNPETTILDLKKWFGWVDARTIESYMGKAGRTTKKMADRL